MDINTETYRLFKDYLDGLLSLEESKGFLERLNLDPELKTSFEEFKIERSLIIHQELTESKALLDAFEYGKPKKRVHSWLVGLGVIAVVLLSFMLLKLNNNKLDNKESIPPKPYSLIKNNQVTIIDSPNIKIEKQVRIIKNNNEVIVQDSAPITPLAPLLSDTTNNKKMIERVYDLEDTTIDSSITDVISSEKLTTTHQQTISNQQIKSNIDCQKINWKPELIIKKPCQEKNNGSLQIRSTYNYSLVFFNNETRSDDFMFYDLASGNYLLEITDKNGCLYSKEIELVEQKCVDQDIIIDINLNVLWEIPYDAILIVRNSNGQTIFKSDVDEGYNYNGVDSYGTPLKSGLYFFELQHGETTQGTITIP